MKYPKFIKENDLIGITAPSAGIVEEGTLLRIDNAKRNMEKLGFRCIETSNVRTDTQGRSSSGEERKQQFMKLWNDDEVSAIIMGAGGDFLIEMLEFLDFEEIKNSEPKWIQGYSDITTLSFVITTLADIATIYCDNFKSYGMKNLYRNLIDAIDIMKGEEVIQHSFEKCVTEKIKDDPYYEYNLDTENLWKTIDNSKKVHFKGRAIGGCLDCILNLIGTKYDNINNYINKYKDDGIVWFLEVYEMNTAQLICRLIQMKQSGFFKKCSGIIFGRPMYLREEYEIKNDEAIKQALGDLNIPIIYDTDIGHVAPQMAIVNGSVLDVTFEDGKGIIKTYFE